jgi:hypothetical protein
MEESSVGMEILSPARDMDRRSEDLDPKQREVSLEMGVIYQGLR